MGLDVTIIEGAPFSGKTTRLIEEIQDAIESGFDPADMAVFAASPSAAQDLGRRLADLGIPVTTTVPREHFLQLLADDEARAITGRIPRLMLPFEYDFFLEDLKTSGLKPRRLREILKFFYRGMADGDSAHEDWLVTNEERELMALISDTLAFTGAMLEAEVSPLVVRALREGATLRSRSTISLVFVDDYALLSRTTQEALVLLSGERLVVTDGVEGVESFEAYPNGEGTAQLAAWFPAARIVELGEVSLPARQEEVVEAETVVREMTAVARLASQALQDGCAPWDMVVAAEHPAWRRNIARVLESSGVRAALVPSTAFLRCDVRREAGSAAARLATVLALAANARDGVAWRAWCGFGDYLANSNGFRSLCQRGRNGGLAAVLQAGELQPDLLDGLDAMGSIRRIEIAHQQGEALLARLAGLEGDALLRAAMDEVEGPDAAIPAALLACALPEGAQDASAAAMVERLRQAAFFPRFATSEAVRVGSFGQIAGLAPRVLVIAGAMNGFFPKADLFDGTVLTVDQRQRRAEVAERVARAVRARASERVVLTLTAQLPLEDAERLGLVVERIALVDGQRMARLEPSMYLAERTQAE